MTDPFLDDGCTGWIDSWGRANWRACCDLHDIAFREGSGWPDFWAANVNLLHCVAASGAPLNAVLMTAACLTVGLGFYWFGPKTRRK